MVNPEQGSLDRPIDCFEVGVCREVKNVTVRLFVHDRSVLYVEYGLIIKPDLRTSENNGNFTVNVVYKKSFQILFKREPPNTSNGIKHFFGKILK